MVGQECENFRVSADACTACLQHSGGQSLHGHPVFPSMLLQISETALENATQQGTLTPEKERRLNGVFNTAMEALTTSPREIQPKSTPSCDVILCAHESNERLHAAIVSILEQEGVVPFLHLVDTGDASRTFNEFSGRWNVRRHRQPSGTSTLAAETGWIGGICAHHGSAACRAYVVGECLPHGMPRHGGFDLCQPNAVWPPRGLQPLPKAH